MSDGLQTGLLTQNGPARHIMSQDVFVNSDATSLRWDMAYDPDVFLDSISQYIALNIIDPISTAVLDTPFKLDPVLHPQELATFTTFAVDVTPYRGQTIRIEYEAQVLDGCFAMFFDNFRI